MWPGPSEIYSGQLDANYQVSGNSKIKRIISGLHPFCADDARLVRDRISHYGKRITNCTLTSEIFSEGVPE